MEGARLEAILGAARSLGAELNLRASGAATGAHRARQLGAGHEFAEHKPYVPGDDLRHLDWRVFARSDRLAIRRYESERTVDHWIVVDASRSMDFPAVADAGDDAAPRSKWELATFFALVYARVVLDLGDRVGLRIAGSDRRLPARSGDRWFLEHLAALDASGPTGTTAVDAALDACVQHAGRGVVLLISDLLCEAEGAWVQPMRTLRARGGHGLVLHTVAPDERALPKGEGLHLVDPETGEQRELNPGRVAEAYASAFAAFLSRQRTAALDAGVRHAVADVGTDPLIALRTVLLGERS